MTSNGNASTVGTITPGAGATPVPRSAGVVLGALGVLGFSVSLPATRVAVQVLDPWFVAFGRAVLAAAVAVVYLAVVRAPRPRRDQLPSLLVVVAGVVVGFPLLTSLALRVQSASHGAVVIAVLPAATAVAAVLRARERPGLRFWAAAAAGAAAVLVFLVLQGGGTGVLGPGDALLLVAVVLCGLGYAEGGLLSRSMGGARTIAWGVVVALPLTLAVTAVSVGSGGVAPALAGGAGAHLAAWASFVYVGLVSMFLGFVAWYAGLARGGIARIGQLQLAQPVLSLGWAWLLLGERVGVGALVAAVVVLACVVATQRAR